MPEEQPEFTHVFELAKSGRAKCRGCGKNIAKDVLRFGESYENPYGDGAATLWFHPLCAAHKRPEPYLVALDYDDCPLDDGTKTQHRQIAEFGIAHRRLPRLDGASLAPTARARCRSCKEMIPKESWRLSLVFFAEARFEPSGYIHAKCASEYFETSDILDRACHFSELSHEEKKSLSEALQ